MKPLLRFACATLFALTFAFATTGCEQPACCGADGKCCKSACPAGCKCDKCTASACTGQPGCKCPKCAAKA